MNRNRERPVDDGTGGPAFDGVVFGPGEHHTDALSGAPLAGDATVGDALVASPELLDTLAIRADGELLAGQGFGEATFGETVSGDVFADALADPPPRSPVPAAATQAPSGTDAPAATAAPDAGPDPKAAHSRQPTLRRPRQPGQRGGNARPRGGRAHPPLSSPVAVPPPPLGSATPGTVPMRGRPGLPAWRPVRPGPRRRPSSAARKVVFLVVLLVIGANLLRTCTNNVSSEHGRSLRPARQVTTTTDLPQTSAGADSTR